MNNACDVCRVRGMEHTIAVRVSEETYTALRELASSEERKLSDVVRRLLRQSLEKPIEVA